VLEQEEEKGFHLLKDLFFECLDRAALDEARQLVADGERFPLSRERALELEYLKGILLVEGYRWDEAEQLFTRLLDAGLPPGLQGRVLNELGMIYEYLGRWQPAVQTYRRSLEVFRELDDDLYIGKVSVNLGITYTRGYEAGELDVAVLDEALACHRRALEIFQRLGQRRLEGRAWIELGTVHKALGHWDEALECYQRDAAICRELGHRHGLGLVLNNIGEVLQQQGRWNEAVSAYREALAIMREFHDPYEEADILSNLGSLYQARGDLPQALETYRSAARVIESLRADITAPEAREDFFGTVAHVYGGRALLCLDMGRIAEAFDCAERARSRAFIELLLHRPIRPPRNVPRSWLEQEEALRRELDALYRAQAAGQTTTVQAERIAQLEARLDELRRRIRLRNAEYASFRSVAPLTLAQVQERVPQGAVLVEYFAAADEVIAFMVERDEEPQAVRLGVSPQALQRACFDAEGRLRSLLPDRDGSLHEPWLLERLYQALLAPIEGRLAGKDLVIFVPHGVLHYLPLHALGNGREKQPWRAVYTPSATVLLEYCRAKSPVEQGEGCLALGYGGDGLRHAEEEAHQVVRVCRGRAVVGAAATRTLVYEQAGRYRYLHFSGRAFFNPRSPLNSGLLLADGTLDVLDILQHVQLQADLVTLSACETGRSRVKAGDELIGLIRAFLYAGTPSVLVTLWPVDDLAARMFMEKFYRELMALEDAAILSRKAEALRQAQMYLRNLTVGEVREFLEQRATPEAVEQELQRLARAAGLDSQFGGRVDDQARPFYHPYYWAPFILVGEHL